MVIPCRRQKVLAAKTLELALTMTCSCLKLSSDNREALRAGVAVFKREGTFVVVVPKIKPSSALSLSYSLGGTGLLAPPAMYGPEMGRRALGSLPRLKRLKQQVLLLSNAQQFVLEGVQ